MLRKLLEDSINDLPKTTAEEMSGHLERMMVRNIIITEHLVLSDIVNHTNCSFSILFKCNFRPVAKNWKENQEN